MLKFFHTKFTKKNTCREKKNPNTMKIARAFVFKLLKASTKNIIIEYKSEM